MVKYYENAVGKQLMASYLCMRNCCAEQANAYRKLFLRGLRLVGAYITPESKLYRLSAILSSCKRFPSMTIVLARKPWRSLTIYKFYSSFETSARTFAKFFNTLVAICHGWMCSRVLALTTTLLERSQLNLSQTEVS